MNIEFVRNERNIITLFFFFFINIIVTFLRVFSLEILQTTI